MNGCKGRLLSLKAAFYIVTASFRDSFQTRTVLISVTWNDSPPLFVSFIWVIIREFSEFKKSNVNSNENVTQCIYVKKHFNNQIEWYSNGLQN